MNNNIHIRAGYAGASRHAKRDPPASCKNGGFYKSPTIGEIIDSSSSFNIAWDTSCLTTKAVDIYLYAPTASNSRIQLWENVPFGEGSFQTTLKPKWWNSTASQSLQLNIVNAGQQPFESSMPAGPVFNATYKAPTSGPVPADADITKPDSGITNVGSQIAAHKHLLAGKIAAAVLVPILFFALAIAAYLKITRSRAQAKSKKWTEAVDKRMSTISTDWKSLSAAGANAAIRHSVAVSMHGGASAFSFGAIRPVESGRAGARELYSHENVDINPQMTQPHSSVTGASYTDFKSRRISKVSFATDLRGVDHTDSRSPPEARPNVASRMTNNPFIPPVPKLDVEPMQREGPLSLTPEDIRLRLAGGIDDTTSMDEVMPALAMMRTGLEGSTEDGNDDYLLWEATSPTSPIAALITPPPPVATQVPSMMPITAPTDDMSPDEMLRVYAAQRSASLPTTPITPSSSSNHMLRAYAERKASGGGGPAFPPPAAMYNGNAIRTLYSPNTPPASAGSRSSTKRPGSGNKLKKPRSTSSQNDEDTTAL